VMCFDEVAESPSFGKFLFTAVDCDDTLELDQKRKSLFHE